MIAAVGSIATDQELEMCVATRIIELRPLVNILFTSLLERP